MKDNDELLRAQIDDMIRGEMQEDINEYIKGLVMLDEEKENG